MAPVVIGALRGIGAYRAILPASKLQIGDGVIVNRNPANAFDANAVQVLTANNRMLGHIDRTSAAILASHMDSGVIYTASVHSNPQLVTVRGKLKGIIKDSILIKCVPLPPLKKSIEVSKEYELT